MASVSTDETVSLPEAAELLGLTTGEVFDLVFAGRLASVATPSGRRVVPLAAIEDWKATHPSHA